GAPQTLITDNGPPFNSSEFKRFCQEWNLEHHTSSPNYPQSDGQAERMVQTVKQRMARCKQDGQDFKQALLQMRTTPISKDLPSPFEILHGRPGRTINGQTEHTQLDLADVKQKLQLRQEKTAEHYNRRHAVRELTPLHQNQKVLIQHKEGNWEPATVKQVGPEPRSYLCETKTGKTFRRNRKHIQVTGMPDTPDLHKSCLKQTDATPKSPKAVNWSEEAYITTDAETAYIAATQGLELMLLTEPQPALPTGTVPEEDETDPPAIEHHDAVPAPIEPPSAAGLLDNSDGEEDNQSHLSDSEREGNAEESLLTPDAQVNGVVSGKAPETRPSAQEEYPGEDLPRRSRRRRRERICYPTKTQNRTKKQKNQAK
ncbi:MAG: hypothetical protein MJE68_14180, partial [Proteobacteria bacterium]|nr:hypothetical protein [Pseudomonadota bacterium]